MDESTFLTEPEAGPWPAFADLFASSSLLFLILFAAVTIPTLKRGAAEAGRKNTLRQLKQVLAVDTTKGYQLVEYGDHLLVRIPDNATFPQGRFELDAMRPAGRQILDAVAAGIRPDTLLKKVYHVAVVGHTSAEGGDARNWLLSAQRAVTVALYLVQQEGLSPCLVSAEGRGKYYPVDPEGARNAPNPEGVPQDRRIELEIWPVIVDDSAQIRNARGCVNIPDPAAPAAPARSVTTIPTVPPVSTTLPLDKVVLPQVPSPQPTP